LSEKPREPLGPQLERGLSLGLSLLAALVALTCGSRGQLIAAAPPIAPAPPALSASARSVAPPAPLSASAPADSGMTSDAGVSAAPRESDPTRLELPHFFADLSGLEQRTRKTPVRILWLGDSHTAADYLTGAVRAHLQQRFGAGGPGFVRVGLKAIRHTQVRFANSGTWRVEPSQPSRRSSFDDGVFGLGGMRASPIDAPALESFEVSKGTAHGELHWSLHYSLPPGASFRVDVAGAAHTVDQSNEGPTSAGSPIATLAVSSALSDKLQLVTTGGAPRFYGLFVEGSEPGVVLDAVGIDGARLSTTLAWGEAPFEAEVAARAPSLVVLAFGTNEAFDADKVEKYRDQYRALLERLRRATPTTDCLLVGPPDALAVAGGSEARVAEIDSLQRSVAENLGCGYVSQLEIMGGPGGYSIWARKSPPWARGDRLHLTPKGYEAVADAISQKLLSAYDRARAQK